jgi:hypothetical protein
MADVIRYFFFINTTKIDIFQREVGKTKRYMSIPTNLISEQQAIGICNIINNGGNIDVMCTYNLQPISAKYSFDWKVKESLKRAEASVYDQIAPFLKGNTNAATSAAATAPTTITRGQTIKSAAEMQQQAPKTIILPITGTIIKSSSQDPSLFYFELPYFAQDAADQLLTDLIMGTNLNDWKSQHNFYNNQVYFNFKEPILAPPSQTKEDLETIDKLVEDYLKDYLAQKNAPAANSNVQPKVADMSGVQLGDPYFLLPVTKVQVYKESIFNIPIYYLFLTGYDNLNSIAQGAIDFLDSSGNVATGTPTIIRIKANPDLLKLQFEFNTENLLAQENLFLGLDFILHNRGYKQPILPSYSLKEEVSPTKPDAVIDIEAQVDKLKTELDQLVFLRSLNSELDFEKNIELGQKIANVKEKINEFNFSKLEAKLTTDDIFDQLFEQSFTPILHEYNNVKVTQGEEGDFFTPNGQPTQLSDQLNEIIRTQQFKDWFGDWELTYMYKQAGDMDTDCSVVLTENFEPKLFYHGTGQEFSYFKFDKFPAAYFAANEAYSQWFANAHGGSDGYTIPFFLNVRNPLDLTLFGTEPISSKNFFDYMYLQTGFDADQLEANPIFTNPSTPSVECWVYLRNNPKMLKKLADNQVYDGIHFYETNPGVPKGQLAHSTEVFITFKPEQCKIADNNRGLILLGALKSFLLEKGGKI